MLVSVVGEKKSGEFGNRVPGAPDPGTEQDRTGFCQRSVQMSTVNNSCIVYDDIYIYTCISCHSGFIV